MGTKNEQEPASNKDCHETNVTIGSLAPIYRFLTSFPTIAVTGFRLGCVWLSCSLSGTGTFTSSGGTIGWILHNPDIAPLWASIFIRPFETWEHIREATAARNLFGSQFGDVYRGSYIHLPPLTLAAFEPILNLVPVSLQPLVIGLIMHMIDLWIAVKFIEIGTLALNEMGDPWEDDLQARIPQSLRPPAEHIFALSPDRIVYTDELPAQKISDENGEVKDGSPHVQSEKTTGKEKDKKDASPMFTFLDLPLYAAQIYYYSPITALASGLGSTYQCFQNIWLLLLLQSLSHSCQIRSSISLTAFWLALGSYMEVHYMAFLIPLSIWLYRRERANKMYLLWFFYAFYTLCLQLFSVSLVGSSQFWAVLWSSHGHMMSWKHLHPNFSVLWYLNMEVFERFRTYFAVLIGGLPYLLLAPLTIRLYRYPMVLATIIWMLWTMFRPTSTLVDVNVALCFMLLCPRSLARMRTGTSLIPALALTVPVTLYLVTLWLWLETGSGEANFTFFQCLGYNGFLATFFLEFCGASMRRDKVLRFTEKLLREQKGADTAEKED